MIYSRGVGVKVAYPPTKPRLHLYAVQLDDDIDPEYLEDKRHAVLGAQTFHVTEMGPQVIYRNPPSSQLMGDVKSNDQAVWIVGPDSSDRSVKDPRIVPPSWVWDWLTFTDSNFSAWDLGRDAPVRNLHLPVVINDAALRSLTEFLRLLPEGGPRSFHEALIYLVADLDTGPVSLSVGERLAVILRGSYEHEHVKRGGGVAFERGEADRALGLLDAAGLATNDPTSAHWRTVFNPAPGSNGAWPGESLPRLKEHVGALVDRRSTGPFHPISTWTMGDDKRLMGARLYLPQGDHYEEVILALRAATREDAAGQVSAFVQKRVPQALWARVLFAEIIATKTLAYWPSGVVHAVSLDGDVEKATKHVL